MYLIQEYINCRLFHLKLWHVHYT
uniref:Uncharacterized protein n=1 Tax=Anguilla anguilla TaxID=7936 RepID=A0A0E9V783_ANGAN